MRLSSSSKRDRFVACILSGWLLTLTGGVKADEGMWIPLLIERYQMEEMQEAGLKLSAEEIYSINNDCLKDAIVIFGGGCTGEMISENGLLLTNHHCGEGAVQSHSTVELDYLSRGFWAMNKEEELPNKNLSVTFLRYMKEVTAEVLEGVKQGMDPQERRQVIDKNQGEVLTKATRETHYRGSIRSFYYGNAYYLFVYEVFRDVRLVGAPPVAIGNYGADQDNWMWPRHTGDFTLFRVYADQDNQPASYDSSNKPYTPRQHLEIAAGGIEEGDFTMILGYPGSTTQYLHSEGVRSMLESSLPVNIDLRTSRLEIMDRHMKESDRVRIEYATKYRGVSNSWKKWQGIILGLNRNRVIEVKREEEEAFNSWVNADGMRQLKYDKLLEEFDRIYKEMEPYKKAEDMMNEGVLAVELFGEAMRWNRMMKQGAPAESLKARAEGFFKNFHMPIDREVFATLMETYKRLMSDPFVPPFFEKVDRKYKGDFARYAQDIYEKSILGSLENALRFSDRYAKDPKGAMKKFEKDPVTTCLDQFREVFIVNASPELRRLNDELARNYKFYMAALMEMERERVLYPDANFTMRLTYGKVDGYQPWDGVKYHYTTTLSGLMEKSKEAFEDYRVPAKLEQLYLEKDYGKYGVDGTMPVCFIASNHTSGGNSGSPVLDAGGRLVGINFDRNWEGTMSDIHYDPTLCRNIAVDIRYILFIVDKFAGAGYLLEEMDIIW